MRLIANLRLLTHVYGINVKCAVIVCWSEPVWFNSCLLISFCRILVKAMDLKGSQVCTKVFHLLWIQWHSLLKGKWKSHLQLYYSTYTACALSVINLLNINQINQSNQSKKQMQRIYGATTNIYKAKEMHTCSNSSATKKILWNCMQLNTSGCYKFHFCMFILKWSIQLPVQHWYIFVPVSKVEISCHWISKGVSVSKLLGPPSCSSIYSPSYWFDTKILNFLGLFVHCVRVNWNSINLLPCLELSVTPTTIWLPVIQCNAQLLHFSKLG